MLFPVSPKSLQRQPAIQGPEPGMGQLCPQHLEHCDMVWFPECGMYKGPMRTAPELRMFSWGRVAQEMGEKLGLRVWQVESWGGWVFYTRGNLWK